MTTGPTDGKVTTAAGGPGGMPLALRLSEGLGFNWVAERAEFERWFVATQTSKNYVRAKAKAEDGTYIDGLARAMWKAWRHAVQRGAAGKAAVEA